MANETYKPERELTLSAIKPVSQGAVFIPLPAEDKNVRHGVTTNKCRSAAERDFLIASQQPGFITKGSSRNYQIGCDTIPGNCGDVTFLRTCWTEYVSSYEFMGADGTTVRGNAQAQAVEVTEEHFNDLFGRDSQVVDYFVTAFRKIHRLDPSEDERVDGELGNSDGGVKSEEAESPE